MAASMARRQGAWYLAVALAATAACSGGQPSAPEGKTYSIGVIPKGTTAEFWNAIHAGAVKAERELNAKGIKVTITWKGPLREDDREIGRASCRERVLDHV